MALYSNATLFPKHADANGLILPEVHQRASELRDSLTELMRRFSELELPHGRIFQGYRIVFPMGMQVTARADVTSWAGLEVELEISASRTHSKAVREAQTWLAEFTRAVEVMASLEIHLLHQGFTTRA